MAKQFSFAALPIPLAVWTYVKVYLKRDFQDFVGSATKDVNDVQSPDLEGQRRARMVVP